MAVRAGRTWVLLLAAVVGLSTLARGAAAQTALEYSVKANFLVRFAAFAEWPDAVFANSAAPMVLCIVGQDPFGAGIDRAAAGQMTKGRPLAIRRVESSELAGCHIVYLGREAVAPARPIAGVLLVTDDRVAARRGAVHFVVVDGRVRFHIDQGQARSAGVDFSSRLLGLALSVRG